MTTGAELAAELCLLSAGNDTHLEFAKRLLAMSDAERTSALAWLVGFSGRRLVEHITGMEVQ